jgi:DNA-binding transcriptional ArsR family regulator
MDEVFKALADPSRRKLLDELYADNGRTLGELCEHLDMTRQAVTKHLVILESANLVVTVWRGREKLHYLNPVPLQEVYDRWIQKYESHRLRSLNDLKRDLEKPTTHDTHGKAKTRL